jgi:hypothetical protein
LKVGTAILPGNSDTNYLELVQTLQVKDMFFNKTTFISDSDSSCTSASPKATCMHF